MQEPKYRGILEERRQMIDEALEAYLNVPQRNVVDEGMLYAVCAGGKRLRPVLLLEGAALAGLPAEAVMPAACSIELLHTYSLVHDDLPAMDNDDLRRGRPTCHVQFGEANAILIGDALLTLAFELLASVKDERIHPQNVLSVLQLLGMAAGSRGMVGGQAMDLEAENMPPESIQLEKLHRLKTGALLQYALLAGAILGGASAKTVRALQCYADNLGLVFQITDDILDVVGSEATLGKGVGSDEKNHKVTYVSRYGLEGAREKARHYVEKAAAALEGLPEDTGFLKWLVESLLDREK